MKPTAKNRADFYYFIDLGTRWSDNDIYGHVNNVMYYSYFDTTANRYLIDEGGLNIHDGDIIGLVVDSGCSYFAPVAFPDQLEGGLAISKLGNSSVRYEIGIFKKGEQTAVAQGHFVHVFVDRAQRQSTPIPAQMREALAKLLITA